MKIFKEVKALVKNERESSTLVLIKLKIIEKRKLYCDLKYSSLYNYAICELGYSSAEANVRVYATRLIMKSSKAERKLLSGKMNLTNAAEVGRVLRYENDVDIINGFVNDAVKLSTRALKNKIHEIYGKPVNENLTIDEGMIKLFNRLREFYGNLSTRELILMLLEKELKDPNIKKVKKEKRGAEELESIDTKKNEKSTENNCGVSHENQVLNTALLGRPSGKEKGIEVVSTSRKGNSRSIPLNVKKETYTGECAQCGTRYNLEYDHIEKYSHGGRSIKENIQLLCRNCNARKEIKARDSLFFS